MTSRTTQYPPYPHPQIHVRGCSLSLSLHPMDQDIKSQRMMLKNAPQPRRPLELNLRQSIPCRKNMKTQCLSLYIVTIYPLVLKQTKKKSQATTDDHNCSNCNSSIYFYFFSHIKLHNAKNKSSKLCHDRMDKKTQKQIHHFRVSISLLWQKKVKQMRRKWHTKTVTHSLTLYIVKVDTTIRK